MEFQFICLWQPWYVSLLSLLANVAGGSVLLYCGIQWVVSRRVGRLDFGRRDAAWLIGLTLLAVTSSSVSLAWLSNFDVGHLPGLFTDRLFRGYAIGYLFPTVALLLAILFWSRARSIGGAKSQPSANRES
ncbi:MAG: hypothetical protein KBI44_07650 [Thermoanaerobaculia bacterium]|nr:hypothetical protein [Thermoanaerobaculia bacterium]